MCEALDASLGTIVTAVAPLPMTTIFLFVQSKFSGHFCG
jgi:hypothetical protein